MLSVLEALFWPLMTITGTQPSTQQLCRSVPTLTLVGKHMLGTRACVCCCLVQSGPVPHMMFASCVCSNLYAQDHLTYNISCSLSDTTNNRIRQSRLEHCQESYYSTNPGACNSDSVVCDNSGAVMDLQCSGQDSLGAYSMLYSDLLCREVGF